MSFELSDGYLEGKSNCCSSSVTIGGCCADCGEHCSILNESEVILDNLIAWLKSKDCIKPVGSENSYIRGWHDCIKDVLRKLREFETKEPHS